MDRTRGLGGRRAAQHRMGANGHFGRAGMMRDAQKEAQDRADALRAELAKELADVSTVVSMLAIRCCTVVRGGNAT